MQSMMSKSPLPVVFTFNKQIVSYKLELILIELLLLHFYVLAGTYIPQLDCLRLCTIK